MRLLMKMVRSDARILATIKMIALPSLFLLVVLYFVQNGTVQYYGELANAKTHKVTQRSIVERHISYQFYSNSGVHVKYLPPPMSIFFYTSGLFSDLTAVTNAGIDLNLSHSMNGRNSFSEKNRANNDFAGILLLMGSILMLFYGYSTFRNKPYMRYCASLVSGRNTFVYIILSRLLLICIFFTLVFALALILPLFHGIIFSLTEYLFMLMFLVIWLLIAFVFFMIGAIFGSFKSDFIGIASILAVWLFTVHFIPIMIDKIVQDKATIIQLQGQADLDKWQLLWNFEARAKKEAGQFDPKNVNSPTEKALIESFWNNEYQALRVVDKKVLQQMRKTTTFYQTVSLFTFSTFYYSLSSEISGKGHVGLNDFFRITQELKHGFTEFYKQRKHIPRGKPVVSFIKNNENIYYAASSLPDNTLFGIMIILIYLFVFTFLAFQRYKIVLYVPYVAKKDKVKPQVGVFRGNLQLNSTIIKVIRAKKPRFAEYLYGIMSGYKSKAITDYFSSENRILFNDVDLLQQKEPVRFLYVCHPDSFPEELYVHDMIAFAVAAKHINSKWEKEICIALDLDIIMARPFVQLDKTKRIEVLIAIAAMCSCSLYIFHDITREASMEASKFLINAMKDFVLNEQIAILITAENVAPDSDYFGDWDCDDNTQIWSLLTTRTSDNVFLL